MEILIEYWDLLLVVLGFTGFIIYGVWTNLANPSEVKQKQIRVWLLQAVIEMERFHDGKMGKIKFSKVLDLFMVRYPIMSKFITDELFNKLVEDVLDEMKHLLQTNEAIKAYVEGDK